MIQSIDIKNFKSLKHVEIQCNRINILIGEPNSGKSNFLELLGLLSWNYYLKNVPSFPHPQESPNTRLKRFIRFDYAAELFYGLNNREKITVGIDKSTNLSYSEHLEYNQKVPFINYYKFRSIDRYYQTVTSYLLPPDGENLFDLLWLYKDLRRPVQDLLNKFGYKLVLRISDKLIEFQKESEDIICQYSYKSLSETLQKLIFLLAILLTNNNTIITLEEPDSGTFPYYAKFIGEKIAQDNQKNQFFITTHNPYFLLPILEKTKDVTVFKTYWDDDQTKLRPIANEKILDLTSDTFFNLDNL